MFLRSTPIFIFPVRSLCTRSSRGCLIRTLRLRTPRRRTRFFEGRKKCFLRKHLFARRIVFESIIFEKKNRCRDKRY